MLVEQLQFSSGMTGGVLCIEQHGLTCGVSWQVCVRFLNHVLQVRHMCDEPATGQFCPRGVAPLSPSP